MMRFTNFEADIHWGSDPGFGAPQCFIPPINQENVLAVELYHIKIAETAFLETVRHHPSSAKSTRSSSPVHTHPITPHSSTKSISWAKGDDGQDSRPREQRKSKFQEDADDDDESPASNKAGSMKRESNNDSGDDSGRALFPEDEEERPTKTRESRSALRASDRIQPRSYLNPRY